MNTTSRLTDKIQLVMVETRKNEVVYGIFWYYAYIYDHLWVLKQRIENNCEG